MDEGSLLDIVAGLLSGFSAVLVIGNWLITGRLRRPQSARPPELGRSACPARPRQSTRTQ